ncbi:WXG100 family type VII secretion target [Paenibacillus sp. TRM 82003]|nr:WXG100 family type VII secretion target [Paenibacillus sp. TRM 82003]
MAPDAAELDRLARSTYGAREDTRRDWNEARRELGETERHWSGRAADAFRTSAAGLERDAVTLQQRLEDVERQARRLASEMRRADAERAAEARRAAEAKRLAELAKTQSKR